MNTIKVYSTVEETTVKGNFEIETTKVTIETIPSVITATSREEIRNCSRLFYELTSWKYLTNDFNVNRVKRTDRFIEVLDIKDFVKRDNRLDDIEYIKHHNFKYIK